MSKTTEIEQLETGLGADICSGCDSEIDIAKSCDECGSEFCSDVCLENHIDDKHSISSTTYYNLADFDEDGNLTRIIPAGTKISYKSLESESPEVMHDAEVQSINLNNGKGPIVNIVPNGLKLIIDIPLRSELFELYITEETASELVKLKNSLEDDSENKEVTQTEFQLEDINGVGPSTKDKLIKLGLDTVEKIADPNNRSLMSSKFSSSKTYQFYGHARKLLNLHDDEEEEEQKEVVPSGSIKKEIDKESLDYFFDSTSVIEISKIVDRLQLRDKNNEKFVQSIVENFDPKQVGQLIVQDLGNDTYLLIDGNHRLAALEQLGKKSVPVSIYSDVDALKAKMVAYTSNTNKLPFKQSEKIRIIADLWEEANEINENYTYEEFEKETGEKHSTVNNYVRIANMHMNVLGAIDQGLAQKSALAMKELSYDDQAILSKHFVEEGASYPQVKERVEIWTQLTTEEKELLLDGSVTWATMEEKLNNPDPSDLIFNGSQEDLQDHVTSKKEEILEQIRSDVKNYTVEDLVKKYDHPDITTLDIKRIHDEEIKKGKNEYAAQLSRIDIPSALKAIIEEEDLESYQSIRSVSIWEAKNKQCWEKFKCPSCNYYLDCEFGEDHKNTIEVNLHAAYCSKEKMWVSTKSKAGKISKKDQNEKPDSTGISIIDYLRDNFDLGELEELFETYKEMCVSIDDGSKLKVGDLVLVREYFQSQDLHIHFWGEVLATGKIHNSFFNINGFWRDISSRGLKVYRFEDTPPAFSPKYRFEMPAVCSACEKVKTANMYQCSGCDYQSCSVNHREFKAHNHKFKVIDGSLNDGPTRLEIYDVRNEKPVSVQTEYILTRENFVELLAWFAIDEINLVEGGIDVENEDIETHLLVRNSNWAYNKSLYLQINGHKVYTDTFEKSKLIEDLNNRAILFNNRTAWGINVDEETAAMDQSSLDDLQASINERKAEILSQLSDENTDENSSTGGWDDYWLLEEGTLIDKYLNLLSAGKFFCCQCLEIKEGDPSHAKHGPIDSENDLWKFNYCSDCIPGKTVWSMKNCPNCGKLYPRSDIPQECGRCGVELDKLQVESSNVEDESEEETGYKTLLDAETDWTCIKCDKQTNLNNMLEDKNFDNNTGICTVCFYNRDREEHRQKVIKNLQEKDIEPYTWFGEENGSLGEVYWGDAIEVLMDRDEDSVDLVVTSPPYGVGKEYSFDETEVDIFEDDDEYKDFIFQVLEQCKRVTKPGGRVIINVANPGNPNLTDPDARKKPLQYWIFDIAENLGLIWLGDRYWSKIGANMSQAHGSYCEPSMPYTMDVHETILQFSVPNAEGRLVKLERPDCIDSSNAKCISPEDFNRDKKSIWEMPTSNHPIHPCPYPVEFAERAIRMYTYPCSKTVVLDPLAGSGSAGIAAKSMGRSYIMIEQEKVFVASMLKRIEHELYYEDLDPQYSKKVLDDTEKFVNYLSAWRIARGGSFITPDNIEVSEFNDCPEISVIEEVEGTMNELVKFRYLVKDK